MLASIGATKKQIKTNVYFEALILGLIGIPLGILSGLLATFILIQISNALLKGMMNMELIFSTSTLAILISVLLGSITIYFSARKSAIIIPIAIQKSIKPIILQHISFS